MSKNKPRNRRKRNPNRKKVGQVARQSFSADVGEEDLEHETTVGGGNQELDWTEVESDGEE